MVTDGFDGIKASSDQITEAVTGNERAFTNLTAQLMATGENGKAAAGALAIWRKEAQAAAADAALLGESGNLVVHGLQQIAKAAGNADDKLSGLKAVLEGLGILKTTALDAAASYAEGIDNLSQKVADSLDPTKSFTDLIDQQTKTFNIHADNGRNLLNVLEPLGQEYLNTISKGGDAGAAYENFANQASGLADQINNMAGRVVIGREQILGLARDIGLVKPEELSQKLNELLNGPNRQIFIKMGISQATINDINKQLNNGINVQSILPEVKYGNKPGDGPHGGYADRAKEAAKEQAKLQEESAAEWQKYLDTLQSENEAAAAKAKESGEAYTNNFADGIESENALRRVQIAAGRVAAQAHDNLPGSPAKKGPLSGRGWSMYGGLAYSRDFAKGITRNAAQVSSASNDVAGAASTALASVGQSGDMPGTNAGKFFGQLLDLTNFFSQINNVFAKVSDTVFRLAKFMSDPMGNGTFFGKSTGYSKTASDSEIAKRAADRQQQAYTAAYDSARRPNDSRDAYGMPMIQGPGALQRDASQSDVQAAIVAEGQRRGMSQEQIQVALAIAGNESNYNKNNFGKGHGAFLPGGGKGDAYGVFQQTPEGGWGTPEELMNPTIAINKFFDAYAQSLQTNKDPLVAAILTQNPQLAGTNINGQDYTKATIAQMAEAGKALDAVIKNGAILPTQTGMGMPGVGGLAALTRPSILTDTGSVASSRASETAAAYVAQNFPTVKNIGGSRNNVNGNTAPNTHEVGLAIDIGIPMLKDGVTRDMALGDQINAALKQNAELLNIRYTIWRDVLQNIKDGSTKTVPGHQDHIDVQFNDGSTGNIGPNGTSLRVPYGTQGLLPNNMFGPPLEPGSTIAPPGETVQINPDGTVTRVHGAQSGLPGESLNQATGLPWTEAEAQAYFDMNKKRMELGELTFEQFQQMYKDNNFAQGSTQDQLSQLMQNPAFANVQDMQNNPNNYTSQQISDTLLSLEQYSKDQQIQNTAGSRQMAGVADSLSSSIMDATGFTKNENPIDTVSGVISNASGVASDIIGTVITGIEAIGAADTIAKTAVRGVANTNDVNTVIDSVQKFIEFGAKVSGSVASVASLIGSITSAGASADPSSAAGGAAAAIQGVATIASLVQAGFETANAVIDLTQEAFRIAGSYYGDFLGYLVGAGGGQLVGDVKFLLDKNTNQLLSYTLNNPMDKRTLNVPFSNNDTSSRNQLVGNINMYGGPGTDPRDMTRQMMFQINTAQYAGALAQ